MEEEGRELETYETKLDKNKMRHDDSETKKGEMRLREDNT